MTQQKTTFSDTRSTIAKQTVLVANQVITPRLFYLPHVWNQIQYIIQACPKEVGWWGMVEKVEHDYVVTELYVPEQTVHAAETDISSDAMAALAMEVLGENKDPSKLYYWGHSHVNMGVGPSGQDETQVREYLKTCPVFIRGIYNKRGENKVDIYDVEKNICFEVVQNGPAHPQLTDADKAALDTLIKTNVKEAVFTTTTKTDTTKTLYDDDNWYGKSYYNRQTTLNDVKKTDSNMKKNGTTSTKRVIADDDNSFFLVGATANDYYEALTVEDYNDLHAHVYN